MTPVWRVLMTPVERVIEFIKQQHLVGWETYPSITDGRPGPPISTPFLAGFSCFKAWVRSGGNRSDWANGHVTSS